MNRRQFAATLCLVPATAFAQAKSEWPVRTVRIVCPFAPGGSQDALARRVATKLGELLGQQFIVDNRAGAGAPLPTTMSRSRRRTKAAQAALALAD
jgi:tripartite-type tricarboxylate transporter receptor subunit TctC